MKVVNNVPMMAVERMGELGDDGVDLDACLAIIEEIKEDPDVWHEVCEELGDMFEGLGDMFEECLEECEGEVAVPSVARIQGCATEHHGRSGEHRKQAQEALERVHTDSIGPIPKDFENNTYATIVKDERSSHRWAVPRKGNTSDVTAAIFKYLFPGDKKPTEVRCDGGPEYQKEFKALLEEWWTFLARSVPGEAQSNQRAETAVKECLQPSRTSMARSGAPELLWGKCICMETENVAKGFEIEDGLTADEIYNGKQKDQRTREFIVPFGCGAFRVRKPEEIKHKLAPRSVECVIVGYGKHACASYQMIDLEDFQGRQGLHVRTVGRKT